MEEKEIVVEEPIVEKNEEELEKEEVEDVELEDDTPTIEDFEKAQKAIKTLKAQKEHWKKKAEQVKTEKPIEKNEEKKPEPKKNNNSEQISSSEIVEMSRLAARGYTDEEMELLKDIKNLKGLNNLTEAIESPLFKANKEAKELAEKKAKAQLPPSNKSSMFEEGKEPTDEELKKAWLGK